MSLYLGKIHYWLFDKIKWFQGLEQEIMNLAKSEGVDVESLMEEINRKYGEILPNLPLEDMIDKGNIHGWLQEKINSSEGRMAAWTKIILQCDEGKIKLENIYISQGMKAGAEVVASGKQLNTAKEIYNSINDYILDGMPCDRVDEIIYSDDLRIQWKKRICVHKDIWERAGVNVQVFYQLRSLWIKAFVTEVNSNFHYEDRADGIMMVENSMSSENLQVYELD